MIIAFMTMLLSYIIDLICEMRTLNISGSAVRWQSAISDDLQSDGALSRTDKNVFCTDTEYTFLSVVAGFPKGRQATLAHDIALQCLVCYACLPTGTKMGARRYGGDHTFE